MTYLLINPIPQKNTGIDNYTKYLKEFLQSNYKISVEILRNDKKYSPQKFRELVYNHITKNYGINEVIIEAPEAKASTLLLPKDYKVHIRLHCPLSVAQKYDGFSINQTIYSEELRVIHKAWRVSSPSYGLLNEIDNEIDTRKISVFPNIPPENINFEKNKKYDLLFIGRFQKLKGIESLNPVLESLNSKVNVVLAGPEANKFRLSNNISCKVEIINSIEGKEKEKLFKNCQYVFLASEFENCSMVALESIAYGAKLIAWDVGGNRELYHEKITHIIKKYDYEEVARIINKSKKTHINDKIFIEHSNDIKTQATKGYINIINGDENIYLKPKNKVTISESNFYNFKVKDIRDKKLKVFGFSISNEHIEEMWMPAINQLNIDYYFACRRPLGFHSKFDNKFDVEKSKYSHYDWIKQPHRLFGEIAREKPDFILFHNGLHPMYQGVLNMVKKIGIPIIYTELGWFPQHNHIYFDNKGVNAFSNISCQKINVENDITPMPNSIKSLPVLLCLQLENDTNLIISSKRFKKNKNLIKYVSQQLPNEEIIIRAHPDDKNIEEYKKTCTNLKNITICKKLNFEDSAINSKAIIALNSTVLLNALDFNVNIYALGDGITNNKPGIIDASKRELSQCWINDKIIGASSRKSTKEFFKNRQFNVNKKRMDDSLPLPDSLKSFAFIKKSNSCSELYTLKSNILKKEHLKNNPHLIIKNNENNNKKKADLLINKSTSLKSVTHRKIKKIIRTIINIKPFWYKRLENAK